MSSDKNMKKRGNQPITIGGRTFVPRFTNAITNVPKYCYDEESKTVVLDGNWFIYEMIADEEHPAVYWMINMLREGMVENMYLERNFSFWDLDLLCHLLASVKNVVVSPDNRLYEVRNGLVYLKIAGRPLLPIIFNGRYKVRNFFKRTWGVVDKDGRMIADYKYDSIECFEYSDELCAVSVGPECDCLFGAIDADGKEVIPVIYSDIREETDGTLMLEKDGEWIHVDAAGKVLE